MEQQRRATDPWFAVIAERMSALEGRQGTHEDICNQRHTDNATLFANAVKQNAAAFEQIGEIRGLIIKSAFGVIAALFGIVMLLVKTKGLVG
jgi:hypothetical protein